MTVISSKIYDNAAYGRGGALSVKSSNGTVKFINSQLTGNTATAEGGAIHFGTGSGSLQMTNCTVSGNTVGGSEFASGGAVHFSAAPTGASFIKNSILWDNTAPVSPEIHLASGTLDVTHSDVELPTAGDVWPPGAGSGTGNKNEDPLFVNAANGDFHLRCSSPCKDAGLDASVPADGQDVNENGDDQQPTPDLDLTERIVVYVDMGAYERCPNDFNNDGATNVADLLAVIANWGVCDPAPAPCVHDIAPAPCGDGTVNVADLLATISGWGPGCYVPEGAPPPQSVEDCKDRCGQAYAWGSEAWGWCTDECISELCAQQVIICD